MRSLRPRLWMYALTALAAYVFLAVSAYRFAHPELTETQLFLDVPRALAWRW